MSTLVEKSITVTALIIIGMLFVGFYVGVSKVYSMGGFSQVMIEAGKEVKYIMKEINKEDTYESK